MQYSFNNNQYTYNTNIKHNDRIRYSFNNLTEKTFNLNFETWYQNGYWGDKYIPHVLLDGDRVIANVSVNIINTIWKNKKKCYIQLGTVMTDVEYRNLGLSRFLIEKVLEEWKERCDAMYLYANDSVLDFYPKFGFVKTDEYQCQLPVTPKDCTAIKLNMSSAEHRALLHEKYRKSNPFSTLPMEENIGLIMFYCSQFLKDHVYYVEQYDAIVIGEQDGENMLCYDIFCGENNSMEEILSIVAEPDIKNVVLGFSPKGNYKPSLLKEEDTTLFVLADKENVFADNKLMFPLLSHA